MSYYDFPLTIFLRLPWAKARTKYFSSGVNKKSLDCIEKAAFFVTLSDEEQSIMGDDLGESLDYYIKSLLHGKCYNRYFCSQVAAVLNCEQSCVTKYICYMCVDQVVWQVLLSCFLQKWKEWLKRRALLGWCASAFTLMGGQKSWKNGLTQFSAVPKASWECFCSVYSGHRMLPARVRCRGSLQRRGGRITAGTTEIKLGNTFRG